MLARKLGDGADRGNVTVHAMKQGEWRIEVNNLFCTIIAVQICGWSRALSAATSALRSLPDWEKSQTGDESNAPCEACEAEGCPCSECWSCERWLCETCIGQHPEEPEPCHNCGQLAVLGFNLCCDDCDPDDEDEDD